MRAPRCFRGPLIVLPCLVILWFLWRLALLPCLGLRLFTPLLPRVEARLQAPRLFILTLLYLGAEPRIFVLPMILAFSLIYKDSSINFIAGFFFFFFVFCQFELLDSCPV